MRLELRVERSKLGSIMLGTVRHQNIVRLRHILALRELELVSSSRHEPLHPGFELPVAGAQRGGAS